MEVKFEIVRDIDVFNTFDNKKKIEFIKHLSRVVCYNKDYQKIVVETNFLQNLLIELNQFKTHTKDYLIMARLFFLLFNNSIIDNTDVQKNLFSCIFIRNFDIFNSLCHLFINDLKINKFFLSTFFNLVILNKENLIKIDKKQIFILHQILKIQIDEKQSEIDDVKEINDWKYLIIRYIIKSKEKCHNNINFLRFYIEIFKKDNIIKDEIIEHIYCQDQLIIFEFIRDFLELQKESSEIEINEDNLEMISSIFLNNLTNIYKSLLFLTNNNLILKFEINDQHNISINFKLFLCLVDILGILLPIKEVREFLQKGFNFEKILDNIYEMLKISDVFYDNTFKRNKIKENYEGVAENNIFYCFQTNIFKFLANYFFSNDEAKKYYINSENSLRFYYLLNHMKIDKSNPFKKEWAVLVVKALCEDCIQIQNKILELKVNDIDPFLKEYLLKNNYDFKIDKENYKITVNKKHSEN